MRNKAIAIPSLCNFSITEVVVPAGAIEVVVTHVVNPYSIYLYEVENYYSKLQSMQIKIQKFMKMWRRKYGSVVGAMNDYVSTIGDHVIVPYSLTESPSFTYYRGIVVAGSSENVDVLLVDIGIVVLVPHVKLLKYEEKYIPEQPLVMLVAITDILPIDTQEFKIPTSSTVKKVDRKISGQWSAKITNYLKSIIKSSSKVFFHAVTYDKKENILFGDIYVNIESKNFSLREILVRNTLAVRFNDDLRIAVKTGCNSSPQLESESRSSNTVQNSRGTVQRPRKIEPVHLLKRKHVEKFIEEKIMIHSPVSIRPLKDISDAQFTSEVHLQLSRNGYLKMKIVQSHMWAAIKRGLNVVTIGGKSYGKGIGYVPPIVSYIAENEMAINNKRKGETITKPVALILCSSASKVIETYTRCQNLSKGCKSIATLEAYNGIEEKKIMSAIINKCSIVVSTPPFLRRFLESKPNELDLSELAFFVLDHADVILEKYLESDLSILIKKYKIFSKTRTYGIDEKPMQLIAVGREWSKTFNDFISVLKSEYELEEPYYCIGSHLEAAVYSGVKAKMVITKSSKKKFQVIDHLNKVRYLTSKTIIICQNAEEANSLFVFLNQESIKSFVAHEDMVIATEIQEIRKKWLNCVSGNYPVLIATDPVLSDINISDIECLIHYSVTLKSRGDFCKRFSVLMDNLFKGKSNKCDIFIIADEKIEIQFNGLIKILKRLGISEIPGEWLVVLKQILYKLDIEKKNFPLCENVKMFGHCESRSACKWRHSIINEVDAPVTNISIGDEVTLHVLCIHSATKMSGRLIICSNEDVDTSNRVIKISNDLQEYFEVIENRRIHKTVEVGDICAYMDDTTYFKVQILEITKTYPPPNMNPQFVMIKNWHNGSTKEVHVNSLREIPEDIKNMQTNILDIYLIGFAPHDNEQNWTQVAKKETHQWFQKNYSAKSFIFGKVAFHIGSSIWLEEINIKEKVDGYNDLVSSTSLKSLLKSKDHGVENHNHLSELEALASHSSAEINDISEYYAILKSNTL